MKSDKRIDKLDNELAELEKNDEQDELKEVDREEVMKETCSGKYDESLMMKELSRCRKRRLRREESGDKNEIAAAEKEFLKIRNKYVELNSQLVWFFAHKYVNITGADITELFQVGNIGLIKALDGFDPDKGYKLSTYAVWWIEKEIRRYLREEIRPIRMPSHIADTLNKIAYIKQQYITENGESPDAKYIAEKLNIPEQKINTLLSYENSYVSIDAPVASNNNDSDDLKLGAMLEDDSKPADDMLYANNMHNTMEKVVNTLPEMERFVINYKYGLNGYKEMSLDEIAEMMHITKERIKALDASGRELLKKPKKLKLLMEFYYED